MSAQPDYPEVWRTGDAMAKWDFEPEEQRGVAIGQSQPRQDGTATEVPPKDIVSATDVIGTAAILAATFAGPLLATFGKGKMRRFGLALTVTEGAVIAGGLAVSGV